MKDNLEGRWNAVYDAMETAIQFTACFALAAFRGRNPANHTLTSIWQKLQGNGATLGEWTTLLIDMRAQAPLRELFPDLADLLDEPVEKSSWWNALRDMRQLRNNKSHHKGPRSGLDFADDLKQAKTLLTVCYKGLRLLSRYKLVEVVAFRMDPLHEQRTANIRALVGCHPDVLMEERSVAHELGEGLYIEDPQGAFHLISPWLIYRECPTHRKHEVFNPEKQTTQAMIYKGVYCGKPLEQPREWFARLRHYVGATP